MGVIIVKGGRETEWFGRHMVVGIWVPGKRGKPWVDGISNNTQGVGGLFANIGFSEGSDLFFLRQRFGATV